MVRAGVLSTVLASAGASLVAAAPAHMEERASCTFTSASSAISGKGSCSSIVLSNIAVPAGTTLDMTKLKSGTKVREINEPDDVDLLTFDRSPLREQPHSATKSGTDRLSPSPAAISPSLVPPDT